MDEWRCLRADRDYRLKFPDDLVAGGENGESLNGQIWFGAECLASGSNIMNHEAESEMLRPMAKLLTNTLEQLRLELRHGVMDIDTSFFIFTHQSRISQALAERLQNFDVLFANFEYEYVKAMLPIKTVDEIEKLHELTVLFSEAVAFSLKKELIAQQDIDECHPHVLIAIPRLAIVYGLVQCQESPIFRPQKDQLSKTFKEFHSVLHRVRELIATLHPHEVDVLQRMLTNEEEDSSRSSSNSHRFVVHPKTSCSSTSDSVNHQNQPHNHTTTSSTPIPTSTLSSSSPTAADTSNTRSSASASPLVDDGRTVLNQNHVAPVCRYSHSYPQRGNPISSFSRNYQHRNEMRSTCRLRGIRYHRRRHSDPVSGMIDKSLSGYRKEMGSTMSLITTMKELRSRTAVLTLDPEVGDKNVTPADDQRKECGGEPHHNKREDQECESNTRIERDDEEDEISSQTSITSSSCPSPSSADSFEMPVPVRYHISPGTRQLLQRLFVTISGIADQLQTNSAADLRVILRHVFTMYTVSSDSDEDDDDSDPVTSDSDSLSVEEALEAREVEQASPPPSPSHSSSSSSSCTDSSSTPAAIAPATATTTNVLLTGSAAAASAEATAGSTHMSHHLSPSSVSAFQTPVSMPQTSSAVTSAAIHNLLPESSSSSRLNVPADRGMHVSQRLHEAPASSVTSDCHFRRHPDHMRVKSHRRRVRSEGGSESGSSRTLVPPPHSPDLLMLAPIWVPDELVASCTTCKQSFTMLRRRHHCRNCGQIYCSACSSHTMHLGQFGYTKPVRVCDPCFVTITTIHAYHHSAHTDSSGNVLFQPQHSSTPTVGHN
jgi:hypothetical protein